MKNKTCQDCGKRIRVAPRQMHTKYCSACVDRRDKENRRRQKAKLTELRQSEDYRRRTCSLCGQDFLRPAGRAGGAVTRCETCRATPISRRTLPETRPCEMCGTVMSLAPHQNARFCHACRIERQREQNTAAKAKSRAKGPRTLTCKRCGTEFQKNPRGRDPRACPDCRKADYEARRPPRKTTPEDRYRWRLARQYGLTVEQRDRMSDRQNGCCAICGVQEGPKVRLHVDHDHACCPTSGMSCGKCVRGLICGHCNRTMGLLNEDPETLARMARYLKSGGTPGAPNRRRTKK